MASYVTNVEAQVMTQKSDFFTGKSKVLLHTGNPGKEGKENKAKEETEKEIKEKEEGWVAKARSITTLNALEWPEVKETETYKFFSIRVGGVFIGYGEFTAPIAVEKGDTFKVNKENLTVEIEE